MRVNDGNEILKNPKVEDVINFLKTLPQDANFILIDPDTNWSIKNIIVLRNNDIVAFTGSYLDMDAEEDFLRYDLL